MPNLFEGLSAKDKALIFSLFVAAFFLRQFSFSTDISHYGAIYDRFFLFVDGYRYILSMIHLLECLILERLIRPGKFPVIWAYLCLNPLDVFLVGRPGDLFWILEGLIVCGLLVRARLFTLSAVTGFFTLALVF